MNYKTNESDYGDGDLQHRIEAFVAFYAPRNEGRVRFIERLRAMLNLYAEMALRHGAIPEVGVEHGSGRK